MELFFWKEIAEYEYTQLYEEGRAVSVLAEELYSLQSNEQATERVSQEFYYKCQELDQREDYEYIVPNDLLHILEQCKKWHPTKKVQLSQDVLCDKILGAWFSRSAGCLLGKPIEGWARSEIRTLLEKNQKYPLDNYFSFRYILHSLEDWKKEQYVRDSIEKCKCMPRDDDMDYTILALRIVEKYGYDFQTEDVAYSWLLHLPVYMTYTAERAAYLNLCSLIEVKKAATTRNPYREWIGAQIRADLYGYINPGDPVKAVSMAYKDASLSHVKNGIYGSLYVAAMVAASFVEDDIEQVVRAGMAYIPEKSRLFEAINWVVEQSKVESNWERIGSQLLNCYRQYHRVHTINNAAIVTLALLYGKRDLEQTITIAAMMGLDTDCNEQPWDPSSVV